MYEAITIVPFIKHTIKLLEISLLVYQVSL